MKHYYLFIICIIISFASTAQNKVHNPGFEQMVLCPNNISQFDFAHLEEWSPPTWGTADYFNSCAITTVGIPNNYMGYQPAYEGNAYCGIYNYGA